MLRRLRADYGVRALLCEGGPTLFGALLQEAVVDELFLTLAPKLAGGGRGPTITAGPGAGRSADLSLAWLLERNGSLYLRYSVTDSPQFRFSSSRGCDNDVDGQFDRNRGRSSATEAVEALTEARERTLALVESISDADLEQVHSTLMSPLVWDLGHIAAFEDLWLVHRYGGRPTAAETTLPTSTTRSRRRARGAAICRSSGPPQAREYLERRARAASLDGDRASAESATAACTRW